MPHIVAPAALLRVGLIRRFGAARFCATVVGAAALAAALPVLALEPFNADYQANYMGVSAIGKMTIEPQGGNRWKYTLKVANNVAQLSQSTVFEDNAGQWRPLSGTDHSSVLIKKIRRNAVYDWASGEARWSGDVKPERAGPVKLQAGDMDALLMNMAVTRDVIAGKPLRYRLVDEGRAKPMQYTIEGKETVTVSGTQKQATKVVYTSGNKQTYAWIVEGLPVPVRILQRKNGKDDIDLKLVAVR
jgi:Protein of unknown function (DUF3108)